MEEINNEQAQEQNIEEAKKLKKKEKPQRTFPQHNIEECLKIAKTIAKNNAGNPWGSEQIAISLGLGAKASNYYYLTASSRDYGFTTGTSRSKTIELTPLGRKAAFPENGEQEYEALMQAFYNVDIFKRVNEYYKNGSLPEKRFLYNTLQETFKIFADYHDDFYNIYSENLKYLKMKQPDGRSSSSLSTDIERAGTQTSAVKAQSRELFVIMPFSEKTGVYPAGYFDEVFSSLIVPAAADAGFVATTANKNGSDIIHKTIVNSIYNAEVILADLTEHNPNVLFELGLAIAFKKKVAIIRAKGTKAIFDIDNSMRVLDYSSNLWKSTLEMDVEKLTNHLIATINSDEESYLDIFLSK
jgi:hypothetical protein